MSYVFARAKIHDLSMMLFPACTNAHKAFEASTIAHAPSFSNLINCTEMFSNCYKLLECNNIKTDIYILCFLDVYHCVQH